MDKEAIIKALNKAKENSKKRNFVQSVDFILNFKGIDLKKQENQIDIFVEFPNKLKKKISVCAFVEHDLEEESKKVFDEIILPESFNKFKDKKESRKLASKHNYFVAQSSLMPSVANTFGRVLGPMGKMPNPKIGAVITGSSNLKPLYDKLQRTLRIMSRSNPAMQCFVGKENTDDNELCNNVLAAYSSILSALPNEKLNVKNVFIKLTMGKAVKIE